MSNSNLLIILISLILFIGFSLFMIFKIYKRFKRFLDFQETLNNQFVDKVLAHFDDIESDVK